MRLHRKWTKKNYSSSKLRQIYNMLYLGFFSYFIICFILSACSFFLYFSLNKTSREYMEKSYMDTLNKNMLQFDNKISAANTLYKNIATNDTVNNIIAVGVAGDSINAVSMYLSRDMTRLLESTSFESAYIYFRDLGEVISTTHTDDAASFFQYYYKDSGISFEEWEKIMHTPNLAAQLAVTSENGSRCLDLIYQLPAYVDDSYVHATAVFRINDSVLKTITYSKSKTGQTVILNSNDKVIMADTADLPPLMHYADYKNDIIYDGSTVSVCATSAYTGWKFLYISDNSELYSALKRARTFWLVFIIFSLMLCCGLGVWFSVKNFFPLSELIRIYKRQENKNSVRTNGYGIVKEALNDYVSSKRSLNILEGNLQELYVNTYLCGLLQGNSVNSSSDLVDFSSELFTVILFQPYNNRNLFGQDDIVSTKEAEEMTFLIIQNVFEELFNETDTCKIIRYDSLIAGLYCYCDEENSHIYKTTIYNAIAHGMSVIKSNFKFGCNIGVSSVKKGFETVALAYHEAKLALGCSISGADNIVFYDEVYHANDGAERLFYRDFNDYQKQLVAYLKKGNQKEAVNTLKIIFRDCIKSIGIEKAKVILLHLTSTMISFFDFNADADRADESVEILNSMDFNSPAEVFENLEKLTEYICMGSKSEEKPFAKESDAEKTDNLLPKIIDYIRENFADSNLNLNTVSNHFGFSSYYISRLFKGATGETLVGFIAQLRIEKAKHDLEHTDLSITEIYKRCGFVSEKTFFRTFLKYESVTPGKYRATNKF